MGVRHCIEAVDKSLRATMQLPKIPFGGASVSYSVEISVKYFQYCD